MFKALEKL